jgi:hypothetical protein
MQSTKRLCLVVMAVAGSGLLTSAAPRQEGAQEQSVAEAARKARDKKKAAAKSSKVITDDDLNLRNFQPGQEGLNVVGPPKLETEPPSATAVANAEAEEAGERDAEAKAAGDDAELARLKAQLKLAEKDLDLAQRELALDQDTYFSNPDHDKDSAGQTKLDSEKQGINDKQQEVEKLKTRVTALEELKSHRKPAKPRAAAAPAPAPAPEQSEKPANPAPPQL